MISIDPAIAGAVASFVTLLALIAGGFFWLGKLGNRVGNLENRVGSLESKVDQLADEMRGMREAMHQQRNEILEAMHQQRNELLEEMRRGNQQLLIALANHGHDDNGQPVFRVPVGVE